MTVKNFIKQHLPGNVRRFASKVRPRNVARSASKVRHKIYRSIVIDFYIHRIISPRLGRRLSHRENPINYLFVISPMRSGSSLLTNILNGHPSIVGYGENHVSYSSPGDLSRLAARVSVLEPSFTGSEEFIMDKMVWNYQISDEVLSAADSKFLFLFRDPADTFRSMGKLTDLDPRSQVFKRLRDPKNALAYYQERLAEMAHLAERVNDPERCLLLEYESLLISTKSTLQTLEQFLGLDQPLSERYPVSRRTGNFRYGDGSPKIRAGKIIRKVSKASSLAESREILEARKTYARHFEELRRHCRVVITGPVAAKWFPTVY